ncbi:hypothetical protein [Microbacterium binotii]|uniref:hypothetical protein n=1 Tax=Microbacterium binotii TaxID=462710 RepID=UPI001F2AA11F|nr:hypothetical protein [Microbacterium binotii]UIN31890.1 hypothetical protein LXM64_06805 [Microbacterium binotii]
MSNARDLIPTSLPLPPQDIHPDELAVILAEAAERHEEATAALAAAQDHFDAAERQREYALTEEQKRVAREAHFRIDRMRGLVAQLEDDAERFARKFREACAAEAPDSNQIMELFMVWSRYRTAAHTWREIVVRYDTQQSRDDYIAWERRIAGWAELIRSVTSIWNGGVLSGQQDDVDGLAAVNLRIAEESKLAPRPVVREATDTSVPFVEDLGIRDPARAGMYIAPLQALEFNLEFSKAVHDASIAWVRESVDAVTERAREEFKASTTEPTDTGKRARK